MAIFDSKSAEDEERERYEKREHARHKWEEHTRLERIEAAKQAFFAGPVGQARLAFEQGELVFQYGHDLLSQQAVIIPMVGGRTDVTTTSPVAILNAVCREGWDLINGGFTFVEQGQESRDKFLMSGQNVAVTGYVLGIYLFKRSEGNRMTPTNPWETL